MKEENKYTQRRNSLLFAASKSPIMTYLLIAAILVSAVIAYITCLKICLFDNFLDPFTAIVTFLIAIGIALHGYAKTWGEFLPKTLTVHYTFNGKYYLSCYYADLTSEGDIRMWAQQIGSQMTDGALLEFNPFFDLDGSKVIKLESNEETVMHYEITILLKANEISE